MAIELTQPERNKMGRSVYVVLFNLALLFVALIAAELTFGKWLDYKRPAETCPDRALHHSYCGRIVTTKDMVPEDGGGMITAYVNRSSIRVADRSQLDTVTDTASYSIINISDSFLQAAAIPYEKRLGQVMSRRSGSAVLDVGYSSWAPLQYRRWIEKHPLKPGVSVNVFLVMNDVTPSYGYSNIGYYSLASRFDSQGNPEFSFDTEVRDFSLAQLKIVLGQRSAVYRLVKAARDHYRNQSAQYMNRRLSRLQNNCFELAEILPEISAAAGDYASMSFDSKCWSSEVKASVENAVGDLRKLMKTVRRYNGTVSVFLVPVGWSFAGENIIGKQMPPYLIGSDGMTSSMGLACYLAERLDAPVTALESVIADLKRSASEKNWYFPVDGHWTPHAHEQLGRWLTENPRGSQSWRQDCRSSSLTAHQSSHP